MIMNFVREAKTRLGTAGHYDMPVRRAPCVLVYYDGGLESMTALRAACANSKRGTRIIAVYLEVVPLKPKLVARTDPNFIGNAVLAAALVNAETYGVKIETRCVETTARGIGLERLAADYSNCMIYMGTDPQHPDWLTDYMLTNMPGKIVVIPI